MDANRRDILKVAGTIGAVSLAGCNQLLDDDPEPTEPSPTGSPTEKPTDTPTETPTEGPTRYSEEEYQQLHQNWMDKLLTDLNGRQILTRIENGEEIQVENLGSRWRFPDGGLTYHEEEFNNAGIQEAVNWVGTPIRHHIRNVGNGGAISTFNNHLINYVEKAVDENHPDYEIEGGWITTQGYGNGDSHGVTFFGDQDDNWHHLDTTSSEIVQLNSPEIQESKFYPGGHRASERGGVYDPLMRFEPGTSDIEGIEIDYETKKDLAMDVLYSLGSPVQSPGWWSNIWGQDLAVDAVINGHIREGGAVEDIQEPMKKMTFHQHENPEAFVGVYGETVDDLTVAYGDSSVYNQAMENPEVIDTQWFEENTTPIPSHQ